MAAFRRYALAFCVLILGGPALAQDAGTLRLELTEPAGGLRIVNAGPAPVAIHMTIAVQKLEAVGWVPVTTELNAVERCDPPGSATTVTIAPSGALNVRRWRGFSCSGQCNMVCRANIYYGPGKFRFVATAVSPPSLIVSAPFALPAEPLH